MKTSKINKILSVFLLITSSFGLVGFTYEQVRDDVNNSFALNGKEAVEVHYGDNYNDDGYNNDLDNSYVTTENNVDTSKLGTYEVTYTVNYKNYSKSVVREVNVIDSEAPVINIDCDDEEFVQVKKSFKGCKYTVTDNHDKPNEIKVTTSSNVNTSKKGDYLFTVNAVDSSNNKSQKQVVVHVRSKNELNYIEVSIKKQRLDYYENGKLYLTTPITSGAYDRTPKGSFKVYNKAKNSILKSGTYATFVQYWIGFKGHKYGIHDASWRKKFGTKNYYVNGSHGCVNTPLDKVAILYERVYVGMPVYIKD